MEHFHVISFAFVFLLPWVYILLPLNVFHEGTGKCLVANDTALAANDKIDKQVWWTE